MSVSAGYSFHPINGSKEPIYEGWSWPAFFFGCIWCMVKGLWGLAVAIFLIALVSLAIPILGWLIVIGTWFYLGSKGNELHAKSLLKKGYLTQEQFDAQAAEPAASQRAKFSQRPTERDVIEDLERLQRLRSDGTLSEEEFGNQKARLLGTR